jgi:hypothetical protein
VWAVVQRSLRKGKPAAFPDLVAAALMCISVAVLLAGDMRERVAGWQVDRRWAALPLIIFSSVLRAVQRHTTKTLKAHFSFRLMLLATMTADAVVMLIAALSADYEALAHVVTADQDEAIGAMVAIVAMAVAVVGDVLVAQYFDFISGLALTALALPAAGLFFLAFDLTAPDAVYVVISAVVAILSVLVALGSGQVNKRTKNLLLGEGDNAAPPAP